MIDRSQTPVSLSSHGLDYAPRQGWRGVTGAPREQEERRPAKEKKPRGAGYVVAVQSFACVVVLLLALLLRGAGGEAYTQLCESFRESLMRNDLLATLASLWDGDPAADLTGQLAAENDAAQGTVESEAILSESTVPTAAGTAGQGRLPPAGAFAVGLRVNRPAWPPLAAGTLTSPYGYRENPTGQGEQFHRGIDIAAPAGTPIAAMFFGWVSQVGESVSLGRYVVLEHGDGVEVLYAHCARVDVTEGAVIRAGETVARVGATGDATGNHVHIEVRAAGIVYNPSAIIEEARYA